MKLFLGFLVAFAIGAFCRLIKIPSPAPQAVVGSLLVVTMSVGYVTAGQMIDRFQQRATARRTSLLIQENKHARHSVQPIR